jgi:hypothetical protein
VPGFFEGMKRLINGQPVFDANDSGKGWTDQAGREKEFSTGEGEQQPAQPEQKGPTTGVIKNHPDTFPVVVVKRTRTRLNGTNQDVYCSIVNNSKGPVELDEINLAGRSRHINGYLRAGEEREWLCYSGPRSTAETYKVANLDYKDETGDYFQSIYDVEYQYESDKTYSVEELHLRLPIRDIKG